MADYVYSNIGQYSLTLPKGTYLLECWGASGSRGNRYAGGKGGYAKGKIKLTQETALYITVGGNAGYNGGGTPGSYGGYGGGASHIAQIAGLSSAVAKNKYYMIAGGGGGGSSQGKGGDGNGNGAGSDGAGCYGGSGGSTTRYYYGVDAKGGGTNAGGAGGRLYYETTTGIEYGPYRVGGNGRLGIGGNAYNDGDQEGDGGGGAGLYGGGGSGGEYGSSGLLYGIGGGGGGSGYINTDLVSEYSSASGIRDGNGLVQITIISQPKIEGFIRVAGNWKPIADGFIKATNYKSIEDNFAKVNGNWKS